MKVLMACQNHPDTYNPYWGAFIERSISSIVDQGVDATAVIPRPYVLPIKGAPYSYFSKLPLKDESGSYIKYYPRYLYFPPKRFFYGLSGDFYSKNVTKFVEKNMEPPDIIHAHHVFMDGYGMMKLSREWEVPLVMVEHGAILKEILNWKSMHSKIINTLSSADHIMCVSNDLFSIALKNGIDENKVSVVPIGVDVDLFKKGNIDFIKDKLNISDTTKIILYVGQLIPRKGLKYLIDAIPKIVSKQKNALFVFAGTGPQREELENLCQQKGIQNNILFTGGIDLTQLIEWYSIAYLFVLPSLSEGRPTVIYEAMSCEVPIISTDVGGVSEQIKDGCNGIVIPPMNSDLLAFNINYMLENENLCKEMGKNGRKRIFDEGWTWKNHSKNVIRIYKKLSNSF